MLPVELDRVVPACTMQEGPFERFNATNRGPGPSIENPSCIDNKVTALFKDRTVCSFLHLHYPFCGGIVPSRADDLMLNTNASSQIVFVDEVTEILEDLTR